MSSCGVCFDEAADLAARGDKLLTLPCSHLFCGRCLDEWTASYNNINNKKGEEQEKKRREKILHGEAPCPSCRMVYNRLATDGTVAAATCIGSSGGLTVFNLLTERRKPAITVQTVETSPLLLLIFTLLVGCDSDEFANCEDCLQWSFTHQWK
uniref:RING-type domain-containing protein n=1 Tax=Paramoeba aestuarina TaxID=180227 RepID=A0A7S4NKF0_9EUKA|mmetsp:Transcript_17625/g.27588  ORF Transcript_17625/g.27588 Transcript_17625/m.27588 type:complete len:153 (+) Transcript_17625:91-549(+)